MSKWLYFAYNQVGPGKSLDILYIMPIHRRWPCTPIIPVRCSHLHSTSTFHSKYCSHNLFIQRIDPLISEKDQKIRKRIKWDKGGCLKGIIFNVYFIKGQRFTRCQAEIVIGYNRPDFGQKIWTWRLLEWIKVFWEAMNRYDFVFL